VYLRLNLINYLSSEASQKQAIKSKLDLDFLKSFTSNLDFELTMSQKNSIWEILKEITY
jgi:RecG-like helicase